MHQQVIVTRIADRHEGDYRAFAESFEYVVNAGTLGEVLMSLIAEIDHPRGEYHIVIGEPYE